MGIPAEHDIELASADDIAASCDILGSAFSQDPLLRWLCERPEIYSDLFRLDAECLYKHHHCIYLNRERTGAAMWLPPGISTKSNNLHWRMLPLGWNLVSKGGLKRLVTRADALKKVTLAAHPAEPHFYLSSVGASLGQQGRGIGSALLKAGLTACDKRGAIAYLESSNVRNNPLYERHGFEVIADATLPDGGPTIWFMKRAAREGLSR